MSGILTTLLCYYDCQLFIPENCSSGIQQTIQNCSGTVPHVFYNKSRSLSHNFFKKTVTAMLYNSWSIIIIYLLCNR